MPRANHVGFSGFPESFQRVLPHRLQQSVSRAARILFGDDERFVDEQGQQIEDVVAMNIASLLIA
jgi:hypothetical protein